MAESVVAQLRAELSELQAEREQSEAVFGQLERQFREQQEEVSSVRTDRERLAQANRALGTQKFPGLASGACPIGHRFVSQSLNWTHYGKM